MSKRIITVLLSLAMLICMVAVPVSAAPSAATNSGLNVSETTLSAGSTFTVSLKVPAVTEKISDASFKVAFDKSAFEVTAINAPAITGCNKVNSSVADANSNGFFSCTQNQPDGDPTVTFGGYTLSATFKVKADAAQTSYNFTIDSCKVNTLDPATGVPSDVTPNISVNTVSVTVTAPVAVTGVTLNKTALSLKAGASETLTATVAPSNAANKNVTWKSSNTAVATVSGGKVTAVKAGTATITVTTADGNKSATCTVTVTAAQTTTSKPTTQAPTYSAPTNTTPTYSEPSYDTPSDTTSSYDSTDIPSYDYDDNTDTVTSDYTDENGGGLSPLYIILFVAIGLALAVVAFVVVVLILKKKKAKKAE